LIHLSSKIRDKGELESQREKRNRKRNRKQNEEVFSSKGW